MPDRPQRGLGLQGNRPKDPLNRQKPGPEPHGDTTGGEWSLQCWVGTEIRRAIPISPEQALLVGAMTPGEVALVLIRRDVFRKELQDIGMLPLLAFEDEDKLVEGARRLGLWPAEVGKDGR